MTDARRARYFEKRDMYINKLARIVASNTRAETRAERETRLNLGWDWRKGGRAARDKARAAA